MDAGQHISHDGHVDSGRVPPRPKLNMITRIATRTRRPAFTLIELLVVIAIIATLMGLLLPAIQKVREAASRMKCSGNLKQCALGLHNYHDVYGHFPGVVNQGPRYTSLFVELLPFIEQSPLYDQWDFANPLTNGNGRAATVIKAYVCPSHGNAEGLVTVGSGQYALSTYGGNGGTWTFPTSVATCDGIFLITGPQSKPKANQIPIEISDITDGLSNTILLGERIVGDTALDSWLQAPITPTPDPWIQPEANYMVWAPPPGLNASAGLLGAMAMIGYKHGTVWEPPPPSLPGMPPVQAPPVPWSTLNWPWWIRLSAYGSYHTGGVNIAMADGSVRFMRSSTTQLTLQWLSTRAGGEVLPADW